jgi:uncharacterized membrane protein
LALTPEERQRIYEEERARLDAEEKIGRDSGTTGLAPNLAGLLCYLGMWVTGIIFLILEQKNRTIRFHAAQSIVTFGVLILLGIFLRPIPVAGRFIAATIGITMLVLWLALIVKVYRGELFRVPIAADLADSLLSAVGRGAAGNTTKEKVAKTLILKETSKSSRSRSGDILGSACAIIFNLVALIFLNFYYEYIAYYSQENGAWIRQPLVTGAWSTWLPVVNVAIVFSLAGYITLIIYNERRLVRETVRIVLDAFALMVLGSLLSIFPFDFRPLPISETLVIFFMKLSLIITMTVIALTIIVRLLRLVIAIVRN